MKRELWIAGIVALLLFSCQKREKKTQTFQDSESKESSQEKSDEVSGIKCFLYTKNQDTINLIVNRSKNSITGNLVYNLFEKDRNSGTLLGTLKEDTLFADYKFSSEGKESIREVIFIKKAGGFIEASAPMELTNGKIVFKKDAPLKLNNTYFLKQTDCR